MCSVSLVTARPERNQEQGPVRLTAKQRRLGPRGLPLDGLVGLGSLPGGAGSYANGVSGDGLTVVGSGGVSSLLGTGEAGEAFRCTAAAG